METQSMNETGFQLEPEHTLRMRDSELCRWLVVAFAVLWTATVCAWSGDEPKVAPQPAASTNSFAPQEIQLRGKVVCLAEEMHRLYQTDLAAHHEHLFGFKTDDDKYYTLLRTKYSEALFVDQRLREKQLILKGRLFPGTKLFEAITMRSVRDGVMHELYYYCTICAIRSVSPAPCECCQGPVELVEKPVRAPH